MPDNSLTSLLVRWEELLRQGQEISAQELCRDCPELVEEVQAAIAKLKGQQEALKTHEATALEATEAGAMGATQRSIGALPATIGPYKIVRELGRGGMGVVYQAWDPRLKRSVALKMILSGSFARQEERQLFWREAEAVARLHHPNIVQIHEIAEHEGHPYITLEYVDGGSLADRLRESPLAPEEAARLCETLAQAMQAAHDQGIIHRDLKPANILLAADRRQEAGGRRQDLQNSLPNTEHRTLNTPKIADFGLAKHLTEESESVSGGVKGTPSYMAPEQAIEKSSEIGARTDVYAIGAILYEMLTGRPPFRGASVLDTLAQVRTQEPVPPRALQPSVPRDLETICLKCLQKEPNKRYGSASALAEDLRRYSQGEPIHARPVSRVERLWRWSRRNPAAAGFTVAAGLLVLSVFSFVLWFQHTSAAKALRDAEIALQLAATEKDIRSDVARARKLRAELLAQLRKPGGVRRLVAEPAAWQGRIKDALSLLKQARGKQSAVHGNIATDLIDEIGELESKLRTDEGERKLALRLEQIREDQAIIAKDSFDLVTASREYGRAFRSAGVDVDSDNVQSQVGRIRDSAIREQFAAALDDWALVEISIGKKDLSTRLFALARGADPDPLRDRLRNPRIWMNKKELAKLVQQLEDTLKKRQPAKGLSPQTLTLVRFLLAQRGADRDAWLRAAQAQHPSDFWLNYDLAHVLMKTQPAAAAGYFRAALARRPNSSAVYLNLGIVLFDLGQLHSAVDAYHKAIAIDSGRAKTWYNLGNALHAQQKLPEAVSAFRKATQLNPKYALAFNNLGNVLYERGKLKEASEALQTAITLDPKPFRAYNNLALVHKSQKNYTKAIGYCKKAIAANPRFAPAYDTLGRIRYEQKKLPEAIASYRKAIEIDPMYAKAHLNLGGALYDQKKLPQAIAAFKTAIKLRPNYALAYLNLGGALYMLKDYCGAIPAFQQAIELNPESSQARLLLAMSFLESGRFPEAQVAGQQLLQYSLSGSRNQRVAQRILKRCQTLMALDKRLEAVIAGEKANAAEQLGLAKFCLRYKRQYHLAVRLYRSGFAASAKSPTDLNRRSYYFDAALAAVLAAFNAEENSRTKDDKRQAQLRNQALAWMRTDVARLAEELNAGNVLTWIQLVDRDLPDRLSEEAMSHVRDAAKVARLPFAEQRKWQEVWADVRELQQKLRARFKERQIQHTLTSKAPARSCPLSTAAGKTYVIDMESNQFDTFVRLEDSQGRVHGENDDVLPPRNLNSRIVFKSRQSGVYRVIATSFQQRGRGAYTLRIREFTEPSKKLRDPKR